MKKLNIKTKKKSIGLVLIILIFISTTLVYINLEKIDFFSSETENIEPHDDDLKQDESIDPITKNITNMIKKINENLVEHYLKKLTSFGPRPTARRILSKIFDLNIEKVSRYLYKEFQSMGLEVNYKTWEQKPTLRNLVKPVRQFGWFSGKNIEAIIPGVNKSSNEIYVVSAHYDSWWKSEGANDNGASVAAILSVAKIMSQYTFEHTIRFVLTDGEEQGLFGSNNYAVEAIEKNENIVGSIFLEVFGLATTQEGSNKICVVERETSSWISDIIVNTSIKYNDQINLEVHSNRETKYGGDFLSFLDNDIDSVTIYQYEMDNKIHTFQDTHERLNMHYLSKGTKLLLASVAEIAYDLQS